MTKTIFLMVGVFIFFGQTPLYAFKVAVFDFDDRLEQPLTTAKYIEEKLKIQNDGIKVDQYSGKKDTALSIKLLNQLDNSNIERLEKTITMNANLLKQYEELLVVEQDPKTIEKYNLEIKGIKLRIEEAKKGLLELKK